MKNVELLVACHILYLKIQGDGVILTSHRLKL